MVRAWRTHRFFPETGRLRNATIGTREVWPEDEFLPEIRGPQIGISLSGGGSRALSAGLGALRGLHDLQILQKARYLSGVSGGGWATSVYTFAQMEANFSDEMLLGEYWEPEEITWAKLNVMDSRSARARPVGYNVKIAEASAEAALEGWSPNRVYEVALSKLLLEPHGIQRDSLLTWDNRSLADALSRNPSLSGRTWLAPTRRRPFAFIQTALAGPRELEPYPVLERMYTQAEITALYVGRAATSNITYTTEGSNRTLTLEVGGFVEPLGMGGTPPPSGLRAGESEGTLHVPEPDREFTLARAVAQASWAAGGFLSEEIPWIDAIATDAYAYWSPESARPASTVMDAFDSGTLDNLGVMSLLRRGVERIIAIDSTGTPLANRTVWDPATRTPTGEEVDGTFAILFGVDVDPYSRVSWDYHRNQVFQQEDFAKFATKLQDAEAEGLGAVATMRLQTVRNNWYGIPAGQEVDLTVVYLSRVTAWEERLSDEVRQRVFPESGGQSSSWGGFPNVGTSLMLGRRQVNLLATLVASAIKLNADGALRHLFA